MTTYFKAFSSLVALALGTALSASAQYSYFHTDDFTVPNWNGGQPSGDPGLSAYYYSAGGYWGAAGQC